MRGFLLQRRPMHRAVPACRFFRGGGKERKKDSVLIPLQPLQARWKEIAGYKDKDVLIYCATGNRSSVAAKIQIDNGFKRICNLRQGISGWESEKNPVVQ